MTALAFDQMEVHSDREQVERLWRELSHRWPASYFLSWGWIEHWLDNLPAKAQVRLIVGRDGDGPAMAFFAGRGRRPLASAGSSRCWFLNESGMPEYDFYIEYNAILCRPDVPFCIADIASSLPEPWDEFVLPGLDSARFPGMRAGNLGHEYHVMREDEPSPYVDLDMVRSRGGYLGLLSANTRQQIKRSYRAYRQDSPVMFEPAKTADHAVEIFEELVELHQARWQQTGRPGAFPTPTARRYHSDLIRRRFPAGEVQLCRLVSGKRTLGCLYNFVFRGRVYFIQSGFAQETDARLKPGYLTHVEAVLHNTSLGHVQYDFLAGASRYKQSLATHANRMIWLRLQRPRAKLRIERGLHTAKRTLASLMTPNSAP